MTKLSKWLQIQSRKRKLRYFMELMGPFESDKVVAVGVDVTGRNPIANMIEDSYPYQENLVRVTADSPKFWTEEAKKSNVVYGDGRDLPFGDNSFDICISNATIEHVGSRDDQRKFISELCRVAPRVFLTTPNYYFPFEVHARLPFVHFLPERIRNFVLEKTGRRWVIKIRLLTAKELKSLFPKNMEVKVFGSRVTLLSESLVAVAHRNRV